MIKQRNWVRRLLSPAIRRGGGLARDEKGAVAIEFAILAPIFFALVFAIIETSMAFFAQQVLESALQDSTRFIRTGQSQISPKWNATAFRKEICSRSFGLLACSAENPNTDRLWIKVKPLDSFTAAPAEISSPVDKDKCTPTSADPEKDCDWSVDDSYNGGVGSSVIIAQAYYKWPTLFNLPWFNFANQAGNNRLLSAVRVFKNEPFGGGAVPATP